MKFSEYIKEEKDNLFDLFGMTINGTLVTSKTINSRWDNHFECDRRGLTSLKYAPYNVTGTFNCAHNKLKTLKYCPVSVENHFDCSNNELLSLDHSPKYVGNHFYCEYNKIKSLKGLSNTTIVGVLDCSNNELSSLEGAPEKILGFYCTGNGLKSLEGAPKEISGNFDCSNNNLTNLKDIHKMITRIGDTFECSDNPIKSHVLGLLLIQGLKHISFLSSGNDEGSWVNIVNKYLSQGRSGLIKCQNELIEAGLEEYAQL